MSQILNFLYRPIPGRERLPHDVAGVHFLVMEYVRGHNLKRIVEANGPLSVRRAIDTILQAARGLSFAHARGVIHRDIKPSNLMQSGDGTIKVLDMGLARFEAPDNEGRTVIGELTQGGLVMGTPTFMAPEQAIDAHSADQRADIYSLGCTLYFLLTTRAPYLEDSGIKMIIAHREQPIPDLDAVRDDVPPELSDLYRRMLAKRPEDRVQSMDDVIAALEAIELPDGPDTETVLFAGRDDLSGVGVDAPEFSSTSKLHRRFAHRNWKWSTALAGFMVLIVLGALYLSGVLLKVQTEYGTLFVEIPDGLQVDVSVNGNKADIEYTEDGWQVKLQLAADEEHQISVTARDGTRLKVDNQGHVSVPAGQDRVIRAWFEPKPESLARTAPPEVEPQQPHLTGQVPAPEQPAAERVPRIQETIYGSGRRMALGIIPLPQKLPGVRQWQVETVRPRTAVTAAAYSPNGRKMALGMESGLVRVYDTHTFDLIALLIGHSNRVVDVAWSPDSEYLASGGDDATVRLWNADGGLGPVLNHNQGVHRIAWSPDAKQLATTEGDGSLKVWNTDGSRVAVFEGEQTFSDSVAWSGDGAQIAAVDSDHTIRIWSLEGGSAVLLQGHSEQVMALAFSPNGEWLASGGRDKTVRLWRSDGTPGPALKGHTTAINAIIWRSDGIAFASTEEDEVVRLWSVDGQPGAVLTDRENRVLAAGWSADGEEVYVASDSRISRWTADGELVDQFRFDHRVHSLDWSPDGQKLAVASSDGTVRLRSAKGDHESDLTGHRGEVVLVRWSPKGDNLAAGVSDPQGESVHLWSAGETPGAASYQFYENRCPLAWSPNGLELVMAHHSRARIWRGGVDADDVMDGGPFEALVWSPDGEILAGGNRNDGDVHLWVRKSQKHLVLKGHTHCVNSLAWSPDSERLASGQDDGTVRLWRKDGTPGPLLDGGDEPVKSVVWSPDGKWLAVEDDSEVVQLWGPNGVPGRIFKQPFGGFESKEGLWSPDSSRLAVLGGEALHVYSIDGTREVQVPARKASYTAVDWSPDGSRIAVGAVDNTVLVCDGNTIEPL